MKTLLDKLYRHLLLRQPINSASMRQNPFNKKLMSLNPKQYDTFRFEKNKQST